MPRLEEMFGLPDSEYGPGKQAEKKKRSKPIRVLLAEEYGGTWTYDGKRWNCDDGEQWAGRRCTCFPDDSKCSCGGPIYVYGPDEGRWFGLANLPLLKL